MKRWKKGKWKLTSIERPSSSLLRLLLDFGELADGVSVGLDLEKFELLVDESVVGFVVFQSGVLLANEQIKKSAKKNEEKRQGAAKNTKRTFNLRSNLIFDLMMS